MQFASVSMHFCECSGVCVYYLWLSSVSSALHQQNSGTVVREARLKAVAMDPTYPENHGFILCEYDQNTLKSSNNPERWKVHMHVFKIR